MQNTIKYVNTRRIPRIKQDAQAYVVDTSALGTERAGEVLDLARTLANVYTTQDVCQEIHYNHSRQRHARHATRSISRYGIKLIHVLERQQHIMTPCSIDPELRAVTRALPKHNAYTRAEAHFVQMYTRCTEVVAYRRGQDDPLTIEHLRTGPRGTSERLNRIITHTAHSGLASLSEQRSTLEQELSRQYLRIVDDVYLPFRERMAEREPPIERDLHKAFCEQLNALWMRMLGAAILDEHWMSISARRADFEVSTADRGIVQLAYDLSREGMSVQILSSDIDLLHYIWMRDSIRD